MSIRFFCLTFKPKQWGQNDGVQSCCFWHEFFLLDFFLSIVLVPQLGPAHPWMTNELTALRVHSSFRDNKNPGGLVSGWGSYWLPRLYVNFFPNKCRWTASKLFPYTLLRHGPISYQTQKYPKWKIELTHLSSGIQLCQIFVYVQKNITPLCHLSQSQSCNIASVQ